MKRLSSCSRPHSRSVFFGGLIIWLIISLHNVRSGDGWRCFHDNMIKLTLLYSIKNHLSRQKNKFFSFFCHKFDFSPLSSHFSSRHPSAHLCAVKGLAEKNTSGGRTFPKAIVVVWRLFAVKQ